MTKNKDKANLNNDNLNDVDDIHNLSLEDLDALDKEIEASNNADEDNFDFEELSFDDHEENEIENVSMDEISDLDFEKDLDEITSSKNSNINDDIDDLELDDDFDVDNTEAKSVELDELNDDDFNFDLDKDNEVKSNIESLDNENIESLNSSELNDLDFEDIHGSDINELNIENLENESTSIEDTDFDIESELEELDFDSDKEELVNSDTESLENLQINEEDNIDDLSEINENLVGEEVINEVVEHEKESEDFEFSEVEHDEDLNTLNFDNEDNIVSATDEDSIDLNESDDELLDIENEIEDETLSEPVTLNSDEDDFDINELEEDDLNELDSIDESDLEDSLSEVDEPSEFVEEEKETENNMFVPVSIPFETRNSKEFTEEDLENLDMDELEKLDQELSEENAIDSDNETSDVSSSTEEDKGNEPVEEKKKKSTLAIIAIAGSAILAGGLGYLYINDSIPFLSSNTDEEEENYQEQVPVKKSQKVAKEPVTENNTVSKEELLGLDTKVKAQTEQPKTESKPVEVAQPVAIDNADVDPATKAFVRNELRSMGNVVNNLTIQLNKAVGQNNQAQESLRNIEQLSNDLKQLSNSVTELQDKIDKDNEDLNEKLLLTMRAAKTMIDKAQEDSASYEKRISDLENKYNEPRSNLPTSKNEQEALSQSLNNLQKSANATKTNNESLTPIVNQIKKTNSNGKKSVNELLQEQATKGSSPLSLTVSRAGADTSSDDSSQTEKKYYKPKYTLSGVIDDLAYIQDESGIVTTYSKGDVLVGYGKIVKVYIDGRIQTENGFVKFENN